MTFVVVSSRAAGHELAALCELVRKQDLGRAGRGYLYAPQARRDINFSSNFSRRIPNAFAEMKQLTTLNLSNNELRVAAVLFIAGRQYPGGAQAAAEPAVRGAAPWFSSLWSQEFESLRESLHGQDHTCMELYQDAAPALSGNDFVGP